MKKILSQTRSSFIATCNVCGTLFKYDKEDIYPDKFNLNNPFNCVDCPVCNNHIPHYKPSIRITTESL